MITAASPWGRENNSYGTCECNLLLTGCEVNSQQRCHNCRCEIITAVELIEKTEKLGISVQVFHTTQLHPHRYSCRTRSKWSSTVDVMLWMVIMSPFYAKFFRELQYHRSVIMSGSSSVPLQLPWWCVLARTLTVKQSWYSHLWIESGLSWAQIWLVDVEHTLTYT